MSVPASRNVRIAIAAVVVAAGALAYANALSNGATNFDDLWQVTSNPLLQPPLTLHKFVRILFFPYHGEYQPVKLLSYLADRFVCGAFGANLIFGMHLTNVVFHLANSVLVAFIAAAVIGDIGGGELRTSGAPLVAVLAGVYFAVHPIHVESVAWLSSRKDVLAFFFMALAFHAFRRAAVIRLRFAGTAAFVFFLLALGSKATVLSFPLIALAYWALLSWRGGGRILLLLVACAAASVAFMVLGMSIISSSGYASLPIGGSRWLHFLTAVKTFPFYMQKMLFPVRLSVIYPAVPAAGTADAGVLWGALTLIAQLAMVFFIRVKMVRFIVLWYLLSLIPVLQFVPMPVPAFTADRYAYIASVPFALAPAIILWQVRFALARRGALAAASILVAAGVLYAGILGVAAWSRNRVWRSSETLWKNVLAGHPADTFALVNLGQFYLEAGDYPRSIELFNAAAASDRGFLTAYLDLGLAYERTGDVHRTNGRTAEARECCLKARDYYLKAYLAPTALTLRPTLDIKGCAALGVARIFFQERKFLSARSYADEALRFSPGLDEAKALSVRADAAIKQSKSVADDLIATGDAVAEASPDRAVELYRKAVDYAPEYPAPYVSLARLYLGAGDYQKACDYYALAFLAGKKDAEFEYEYGVACLRAANYDVAAERLSRALAIDPSLEKAKVKLAIARAYLGHPAQALRILKEVLDANPGNQEAAQNFQAIKTLIEKLTAEPPDARN